MADQLTPDQDPVVTRSYALHYLIAIVLLIGSLFWALWDEDYGQRPWKKYQELFKQRYVAFLKSARSQSTQSEKDAASDPEYRKLADAADAADKQAAPAIKKIEEQLKEVSARLAAVQGVFTDKRAWVNAKIYEIETDSSESGKKSKQRDLDRYKAQQFAVDFPDGTKKFNYDQLEEEYNSLRDEKAKLNAQLGDLLKPVNEAKTKRDDYLKEHLVTLTPEQIAGLQKKARDWDSQIVQINVGSANIVDRCESCHMGIREPVKLTSANMGFKGKSDEYSRAFTSHPDEEILHIHDPEKFGCSPCHQGNGRATTSVIKAHGDYEHWLWPLFSKQNVEAGCQTCHADDMRLGLTTGHVGQVISEGKFLFRQRGCNGCHRYEGYDREPEDLINIQQQIKQKEEDQAANLRKAAAVTKEADNAPDNATANRLYAEAEALKVANSKISGEIEQLDYRSRDLLRDEKKIGPDLKEVRTKLNKNWIPVWLNKPTDFRPTTKMPNFRLQDYQIKAISAYLWQTALTDKLPAAPKGDAARGQELFETRGCLGCHSIGEGSEMQGGDFAANLSRVGEKVNYDYLFRWIKNPRVRTRPYCPYEKKDIGPEDYAKHNLPYQFDFERSTCPNDGHELQVEQMTVMPSLRLSDEEVADIATYLMTQKQKDPASYAQAAFMDDPKLKEEGKKWIRHFGCAGCHEISGFEDEGRIGTELTVEGSKPLERLDFALQTKKAQEGKEVIAEKDIQARLPEGPAKSDWYNHKGFFEHKLAIPNIYDQGMIKPETEKLRMPDPHLNKDHIQALVTFLLGSQETSLPASYQYKPEDWRRDIQEGWWIVRKYNCAGCHQFTPGQTTSWQNVRRFQDPDWKEQFPPKLLTEGARVDPEWLMRFLENPAMSTTDTHRNGVRPYLKIRMPTFFFSDTERRKLVRFFQALSQQPMPYTPERLQALTPKETEMGRSLFSSTAAPCLKCHATGDTAHDKTATAPNFLLAKDRLKPGWTQLWITDPQSISPGTSMPSGLFRKEGDHYVFAGPTPPSFEGYDKDHRQLLVRYIFQLTPEEQRRVSSQIGRGGGGKKTSNRKTPASTPPGVQ